MKKPFTTDGCSGGMTWLWERIFKTDPPWNNLCVQHDYAYWLGGTSTQRREADANLLAGVALMGYPFIGIIMWLAVRIGGHPNLPTPWRWDYGNTDSCYKDPQ